MELFIPAFQSYEDCEALLVFLPGLVSVPGCIDTVQSGRRAATRNRWTLGIQPLLLCDVFKNVSVFFLHICGFLCFLFVFVWIFVLYLNNAFFQVIRDRKGESYRLKTT